MKKDWLSTSFVGVLVCLYAIIASSQVLGLAAIYKIFLVIPLSLAVAGVGFTLQARLGNTFHFTFLRPSPVSKPRWLNLVFLISGLALYLLLVFYPLVHWPFSPITHDLPWDAGLYHFPKAAEMISTGSARDLSIAYGEYPFGYESLIAFALSLNHQGYLLGGVHALISLFLLLSMAMLAARYTRIPRGPVIFLTVLLFLGYQLARNFDSNIWWIFWPQITLVGKNDLFLGASLLAVLVFTPFSKDGPFFPFGLALASAVALSLKPNSALVVSFAWAMMLFFLWRSAQLRLFFRQLALSVVVILPGVLWVFRNLIEQGRLFSEAVLTLSGSSIAANLMNPFFYNHIPNHLFYILGILAVAAAVSVFRPSLRFYCLAALILLATFALTPGSGFTGSIQQPALLEWRFAIALLAYIFVLLLALLEPLILAVYAWRASRLWLALPLILGAAALTLGILWTQRDLMSTDPAKAFVLHDQYDHPVGVNGYYSAYDYVQKNVHHSVVIIENGLPYYLYDAAFTNSVTRSRPADYIVYLQTPWFGEGGYTDSLNQPQWSQTWQLVYEDLEGRVYKRK